ncbi:MAG: asparagine synthase (glutamine-hydrolyzing) [Chitinophagales bacterium]
MCGISGIIQFHPWEGTDARNQVLSRLKKMTNTLSHRGPDGEGFWVSENVHAGFGHRRLSIIDLSPAAGQPMHLKARYSIVYNGELYNYIELREELKKRGYHFSTQSDTEVLLSAFDFYREDCLRLFDGMFAFAIWDNDEKTLFAARDRFGEKPFYYSLDEKEFCFASERKALWANGTQKKINYPLLLNYLVLGQTETPLDKTINYFQNLYSLPPAHFIKVFANDSSLQMQQYWDCNKEARHKVSESEAIERFKDLFTISLKRRLRSDVKTGTSLSGGLDSSSVVALMKKLQPDNTPIESFSAVFPGFHKDESSYISLVSETLGLDNLKISPGADDFIREFDKLCHIQEEPFSSSNVYVQYKVYESAVSHGVKVLLDGQGADETLAGYTKYFPWFLQELIRYRFRSFPPEWRAIKSNQQSISWGLKNYLAAWFPAQAAIQLEKRELRKLKFQPDIHRDFREHWLDRQTLFKPIVLKLNDILYFNSFQSGLEELLRYADRSSMANGREVRLPFLNHELVEFIFELPSQYKIKEGWTKWILRKAMENELPEKIVWRKDKVGFEPPQKVWMEQKIMQEYIQEAKRKLVSEKILKPEVLSKKIQPQDAHAAENYDWRYLVAAGCMSAT